MVYFLCIFSRKEAKIMIVKASELAFLVTINNDKSALYTTRIPARYRVAMIVYRLLTWPLELRRYTYISNLSGSVRVMRVKLLLLS
jgi:hypothetical protein